MKETALFAMYGDSYGEKFCKQEDRIRELEQQVEKTNRLHQLIKAKEIIKELLDCAYLPEIEIKKQAEQFLKEAKSD